MQIGFNWNGSTQKILDQAIGGKKTHLFMANEAKRLMEPYVPFMHGILSKNVTVGVDNNGGYVKYNTPYAGMQYHGLVMIGSKSKSPYAKFGEDKITTSRKLNYSKFRHPLATSYWDKAMKTARSDDLARALQNYVRRPL